MIGFSERPWVVAVLLMVSIVQCVNVALGSQKVPAMFVFGDSIVDVGNNNYLRSYAKSNYPPYGIDYPGGPSGRFSNGKNIVDMLGKHLSTFLSTLCSYRSIDIISNASNPEAEQLSLMNHMLFLGGKESYICSLIESYLTGDMLGLPSPPAYADPSTTGAKIVGGVNYASAAGGILDETGLHYVTKFPFLTFICAVLSVNQ